MRFSGDLIINGQAEGFSCSVAVTLPALAVYGNLQICQNPLNPQLRTQGGGASKTEYSTPFYFPPPKTGLTVTGRVRLPALSVQGNLQVMESLERLQREDEEILILLLA